MLIAKINPPAKALSQVTPFSEPTQIVGEYMKVATDRYTMGSTKVRFQVSFGLLVPNGIDKFDFKTIHSDSAHLEDAELSDWGTDDSVIFERLAAKFGISVTEVVDKDITNDF